MRNVFFSTLIVITIATIFGEWGCKKPPVAEDPVRISVDAAPFTTTLASDFTFNVKVESAMPATGLQIVSTVKEETGNTVYPQGSPVVTFSGQTGIRIINLPRQITCLCTVIATSRGNSSNNAVASFRIVYK